MRLRQTANSGKLTAFQYDIQASMQYILPDLCDEYPDQVKVMAPMFRNFGARQSFAGQITTIKCHEDNSLVAEAVKEAGQGRCSLLMAVAPCVAPCWETISR